MNSNQADQKQMDDSSVEVSKNSRSQNDESSFVRYRRRGFLRAVGGVTIAGLLAGCTSGGSGENSGTNNANEGGGVEEWLSDTGNYDAIEDMTGTNAVTVEVGATGNSGANAFAPAAIKVSSGTMVTWKWVNGYHNVVAKNGQFGSGEPEQNTTFEHTFETAETLLYYCEPHRSMGMKGAIIIAGSDTTSAGNTSIQTEAQ